MLILQPDFLLSVAIVSHYFQARIGSATYHVNTAYYRNSSLKVAANVCVLTKGGVMLSSDSVSTCAVDTV